ncbi:MAG: NAD(+)/NADH kinase [Fibrobacteria bacterium]|nr:NAD(+)/NADH kinase [Fibrobacteria bacterium]
MTTSNIPILRSLAIVAYKEIKYVSPAIDFITDWAASRPNVQILAHPNLHKIVKPGLVKTSERQIRSRADIVLSLGGDGTFLSSARLMSGSTTPILGINMGRLGFLSDVALENLREALDLIDHGEYDISQRMMLTIKVMDGRKKVFEDHALNDVTIAGKQGMELIDLRVTVSGEHLTYYWGDGLLVSTPTGSTAYSLSAGGPIIYPTSELYLLTPLNPKSLAIRPIILPADHTIKVNSENPPGKLVKMVIDGRHEFKILPRYTIFINKHKTSVHILRLKGSSYHKSIHDKLGWSGRHEIK